MRRLLSLILITLFAAVVVIAAPQRNAKRIKRDKQATTQQIKETSRKIDENAQKIERQLNQLNFVEAEVKELNESIVKTQKSIDSIDCIINKLNDSILIVDKKLSLMREKYASAVRKLQSNKGEISTLSFLFSAETFTQAYRRMRYLQQFSQWRSRKSDEIKDIHLQLETKKAELTLIQEDKNKTLTQQNIARQDLEKKQSEAEDIVADLKKESGALRKLLKRKEREAQALDDELERFIAEEQRIAEEKRKAEERRLAEERKKREREEAERQRLLAQEEQRKRDEEQRRQAESELQQREQKQQALKQQEKSEKPIAEKSTSEKTVDKISPQQEKKSTPIEDTRQLVENIESNKGQLPFPVNGEYKIVRGFGIQRHPDLKYVKTNNGGIDIEVSEGGMARAVFAGKVSAIFRQPGFNNIVMVRHGSYITIYANLSSINVKKGDVVEANQTIGQIYSDPDDNHRSILHFEIRKEREKLNPELWLKK